MIANRTHPRYAHEAALTLHTAGCDVTGRTTNVSRGGLCADLPAPTTASLPIGTEVEVELQLVFDDGGRSDALRLAARVVWCTKVDDTKQIGFAFRPLEKQQAKYLNLFLSYLQDAACERIMAPHQSVDDRFC